jgi:GAF domain-containing protein
LRRFVEVLGDLADIQYQGREQGDGNVLALLDGILRQALNLLDAPDGSLLLLDRESDELVFAIVHGTLGADLEDYRIPADEGIAGWVVQNAEAALVRDVRTDQRFSRDIDEAFKFQTLSVAAAPLFGDGRVIGVIEALNKPGDIPFSETDMNLLKLLCRFAGEALAPFDRE